MNDDYGISDTCEAGLVKQNNTSQDLLLSGVFEVEHLDKHGNLKQRWTFDNIVVNAGLNYSLDASIGGGTQVATWYVGLTDGTPTTAATDTMASHAGWTEVTAYSESVRQTLTVAAAASQQITNSASKASFTINADETTIGGCFITSDSAKSGTSGTLFSVAAFTGGDKSGDNGDTLNVTYTLSAADS